MFHRVLFMLLVLVAWSALLYPCYGEFCDEGPPGKYCFENLTGYHECVAGPQGMKDKLHYCPEHTRCKCFYGPPCSKEDPCGPYKLPPQLAGVSTGVYYGRERICSFMGCKTEKISGMAFIDSVNKKWREDIIQSTIRRSFIVLPTADKTWTEYTITWSECTCHPNVITGFPGPEVPKFFQYRGTKNVSGYPMQEWVWQTGGHNPGQAIDITKMFTVANVLKEGAVMGHIEVYHYGTEISKMNFNRNITYVMSSYEDTVVGGDDVFSLPNFCHAIKN